MPLTKCSKDGKSGWKWGDSGHCYTGPGGKKAAIRQGVAIEGPDKFKAEAGDPKNHFDQEVLTMARAAVDSYEEAQAKVVRCEGGYKILGQGKVFPSIDEAIEWQYYGGTAEEVEDGPGVNTKRKGDKKKENFFSQIKE